MRDQQMVDGLLITKFQLEWGVTGVFEIYENDETSPPKHEYINFMSLQGSTQNISIGGGTKNSREFGTIIGEIRVKKHDGKYRAQELAKTFQDIFMNQIVGTFIQCFEASKEPVTTNSHYGINVSIPYYWDYTNGS
jgi:hypothetical protein